MSRSLEAHSVTFGYEPGKDVLSEVSVSVRSGRVLGIVGPNGSGKSTLLRVLCNLIRPRAGEVLLDGKHIARISPMKRARVLAFLPQSVTPAFALSVQEVVNLGRYPHVGPLASLGPHDREVVARCMGDTETSNLRDRDFLTLSGGERQRVLLASILAQEPDILLLDEPTSALDVHHQIEIFALLRRLAREGYGIAVVTHDLNHAARFCDELLLLATGKGHLAHGTPAEVLTEPLLSEAYESRILVAAHPGTGSALVWAETPEEQA